MSGSYPEDAGANPARAIMRVLICGSRNWSDKPFIVQKLSLLQKDTTIIEGGARGVDTIARECAENLGFKLIEFKADWELHGKKAGPIRNQQMIDKGKPDMVIAFHEDLWASKGTLDMVKRAVDHKIPVFIYPK